MGAARAEIGAERPQNEVIMTKGLAPELQAEIMTKGLAPELQAEITIRGRLASAPVPRCYEASATSQWDSLLASQRSEE
eukprot:364975-Chlamydomonas_euryale.AAC.8